MGFESACGGCEVNRGFEIFRETENVNKGLGDREKSRSDDSARRCYASANRDCESAIKECEGAVKAKRLCKS